MVDPETSDAVTVKLLHPSGITPMSQTNVTKPAPKNVLLAERRAVRRFRR